MSTVELNPKPTLSMRLIDSITELPWYGRRPDEVYVVSEKAIREITEELQELFLLREALADAVHKARQEERSAD